MRFGRKCDVKDQQLGDVWVTKFPLTRLMVAGERGARVEELVGTLALLPHLICAESLQAGEKHGTLISLDLTTR